VDILFFSALVPPGWFYGVFDNDNAIEIRIGESNPPSTVVAEMQLTAEVGDYTPIRWIEYKVPA